MFPALKSDRLTLKPGSLDDTEALLAIWRLPAVRRFLFDDEIMERFTAVDWITDMEGLHDRSLGVWIIRDSPDGPVLGHIVLVQAYDLPTFDSRYADDIEFGISLHPDHWGKGYALEARTAALAHGIGVVDESNTASRKLQEAAGFVWQRTVPSHPLPLAIYKREPD